MSTFTTPQDPRFAHLPPPPGPSGCPAAAPPSWAGEPPMPNWTGFGPTPPQGPSGGFAAEVPKRRVEIDVRNLVLALGVTCLIAAAVSFGAANWDRFDASMRAALLVGVTVASLAGGLETRRRGLSGTSTALSWLTMPLMFINLFAIRRAAFVDVTMDAYLAVGGLVLCAVFVALAFLRREAAMITGAVLAWLLGAWSACSFWSVSGFDVWVLPAAALIGLVQLREACANPERGSWERYGFTLVVVAVPAVLCALGDPHALRPIIVIAAATVVLLVGMRFHQLAAVWSGAGVISVLVLAQLVDVLRGVPGWAVFALVGVVLLAVGAAFEYRLRLTSRKAVAGTAQPADAVAWR